MTPGTWVDRLKERPWIFIGVWMGYLLLLLAWYISRIPPSANSAIGSGDPDVFVRLILVRDLMQGGGWYRHVVDGTNAPFDAMVSPWTRPQDMLLAPVYWLLPDGLRVQDRLLYAAGPAPVLMGMAMLYGLWLGARRIVPLGVTGLYVVFAFVTAFTIHHYFLPGEADHHALMSLSWAWALVLLLNPRGGRGSAAGAGALIGLIFWVSTEAFGPAGILFLWFGLLWLAGSARARLLPPFAWGMLAMVAVAVGIERPPSEWLQPIYDSISIVHVWLLAVVAVVASLLLHLPAQWTRSLRRRMAWGVAGLCVVAGFAAWVYPLTFRGPLVGVDPYVLTHFMHSVHETESVLKVWPPMALAISIPPLGLLGIGLWLLWTRRPSIYRPWQLGLLVCAIGFTWLMCCQYMRCIYYLVPPQVLMLGTLLAALQSADRNEVAGCWPVDALRKLPPKRLPLGQGLVPFFLLILPVMLYQIPPAASHSAVDRCFDRARMEIQHGLLDRLGQVPLVLFTSTDLGGEVLFWSPHHIIASNYHREGREIRYIWETETMTDETALRARLAERKVQAMLVCPSTRMTENSVLRRWLRGEALPGWVEHIETPPPPPGKIEWPAGSEPLLLRLR